MRTVFSIEQQERSAAFDQATGATLEVIRERAVEARLGERAVLLTGLLESAVMANIHHGVLSIPTAAKEEDLPVILPVLDGDPERFDAAALAHLSPSMTQQVFEFAKAGDFDGYSIVDRINKRIQADPQTLSSIPNLHGAVAYLNYLSTPETERKLAIFTRPIMLLGRNLLKCSDVAVASVTAHEAAHLDFYEHFNRDHSPLIEYFGWPQVDTLNESLAYDVSYQIVRDYLDQLGAPSAVDLAKILGGKSKFKFGQVGRLLNDIDAQVEPLERNVFTVPLLAVAITKVCRQDALPSDAEVTAYMHYGLVQGLSQSQS